MQENTKSEGNIEKILQGAKEDFGMKKRKGHHANKTRNVTFSTILEQVHHKGAVLNSLEDVNSDPFRNSKEIFSK